MTLLSNITDSEFYTGVGSRSTPFEVLGLFERVAMYLARKNFTLRSGHAVGADKRFEVGCDKVGGKKEIYLPWKGFEGSNSDLIVSNPKAFEIAEKFHPYWHNLSQGARHLQARNSHQVLGKDLKTPSKFLLCWTENGKGQGGTGQAIRIAGAYDIPVFDAGVYSNLEEARIELKLFLLKYSNLQEKDFRR